MALYQVLGIEGDTVEINGKEYAARVDQVELSDEEAAQPLAESKIALVEADDDEIDAPEGGDEDAPEEEAPEGGDDETPEGGTDPEDEPAPTA